MATANKGAITKARECGGSTRKQGGKIGKHNA